MYKNIFKTLLEANLTGVKFAGLRVMGNAAFKSVLSNPDLVSKLAVTEGTTVLAEITSEDTVHGKLLREVALGMHFALSDELLRQLDTDKVFNVAPEDAAREADLEQWKKDGFKETNGKVVYNTAKPTTNKAVIVPANAKPKATKPTPVGVKPVNNTAKVETKAVELAKEEVKAVESVAAEKTAPAVPVRADEFICPMCGRPTKTKKGRVFKPLFDDAATDQMKEFTGTTICSQCNSTLSDTNRRDHKLLEEAANATRQIKAKEEAILEVELEIEAANDSVNVLTKHIDASKDNVVKTTLQKEITTMKNNIAVKRNRVTALQNDINKIKKYNR